MLKILGCFSGQFKWPHFCSFCIQDSISVIGSLICSSNKYSFSVSQIHKINFLYFSGKKQYNIFLSAWFFFFNIPGLTENDKNGSNKKCTELGNIGNLSCKFCQAFEIRKLGINEIVLGIDPLVRRKTHCIEKIEIKLLYLSILYYQTFSFLNLY